MQTQEDMIHLLIDSIDKHFTAKTHTLTSVCLTPTVLTFKAAAKVFGSEPLSDQSRYLHHSSFTTSFMDEGGSPRTSSHARVTNSSMTATTGAVRVFSAQVCPSILVLSGIADFAVHRFRCHLPRRASFASCSNSRGTLHEGAWPQQAALQFFSIEEQELLIKRLFLSNTHTQNLILEAPACSYQHLVPRFFLEFGGG